MTVLGAGSAALLTVVVAPSAASASTAKATRSVSVNIIRHANADSFTSNARSHQRFGGLRYVSGGLYQHKVSRGFMHFTLPAGGQILSAKLTVTRVAARRAGMVGAVTTAAHWTEHSLTARTAPRNLRHVGSVAVRASDRTVTINVTSAFRQHHSASIALQMTHHIFRFASRQASTGRPVLHVVMRKQITAANPGSGVANNGNGHRTSGPGNGSAGTGSNGSGDGGTASGDCGVSANLVPSCGRWWGTAPRAYENLPLTTSLPSEDAMADRKTDIVHVYHVNDQLFPTATEKAEALTPGYPKLLLINWKPATDMSWAKVAAGGADARIDRLAAHIKQTFPYRFFLTIYHEPEDNVNTAAGSGMTPKDYAAMYRHTVLRLRADGVNNAVTVMNYMGFDKWAEQSWFNQLWPGNDVVDWIGLDPYGTGTPGGYGANDFKTLVDRPEKGFPGYYTWATTEHPGKPIMLSEWGVEYQSAYPTGQANLFNSIQPQDFPQIKALVYFDMQQTQSGNAITRTNAALNSVAQAAYRHMTNSLGAPSPGLVYN